MRYICFAVATVLALGASAKADDLSSSDLAQCGLSSMTVMSDTQGMQIRAQGFRAPLLSLKIGDINVQANVYVSPNAPQIITQQNSKGGGNISVIVNQSAISFGSKSRGLR